MLPKIIRSNWWPANTIWFRKRPATNAQYGQAYGLQTRDIVQHEVCKHNTTQHNMVKLVACKHTIRFSKRPEKKHATWL
jgi:hypothetical protein